MIKVLWNVNEPFLKISHGPRGTSESSLIPDFSYGRRGPQS